MSHVDLSDAMSNLRIEGQLSLLDTRTHLKLTSQERIQGSPVWDPKLKEGKNVACVRICATFQYLAVA